MNAWSDLLQALHSALLEELNLRYESAKFELGLPRRAEGLSYPPSSRQSLLTQVRIGEFPGVAMVGFGPDQKVKEVAELMTAVKERAEDEFERRNIEPKFGVYAAHKSGDPKPNWLESEPTVVIWLPIQVLGLATPLTFDLGVGL